MGANSHQSINHFNFLLASYAFLLPLQMHGLERITEHILKVNYVRISVWNIQKWTAIINTTGSCGNRFNVKDIYLLYCREHANCCWVNWINTLTLKDNTTSHCFYFVACCVADPATFVVSDRVPGSLFSSENSLEKNVHFWFCIISLISIVNINLSEFEFLPPQNYVLPL